MAPMPAAKDHDKQRIEAQSLGRMSCTGRLSGYPVVVEQGLVSQPDSGHSHVLQPRCMPIARLRTPIQTGDGIADCSATEVHDTQTHG